VKLKDFVEIAGLPPKTGEPGYAKATHEPRTTKKGKTMNSRKLIVTFGGLFLFAGANLLAQLPARPTARPNAQVSRSPAYSEPINPEQEAANEINRILRDLHVIKEILDLTDGQIAEIQPVIEADYADLLALYQEIHALRKELRELMSGNNPPPGQVGQLIVDIREVEIQIVEIRRSWGDVIEAVLDNAQREILARVRHLARILPAFRGVGLIPPPPAPAED
jgi:hypothetical protein